MATFKFKCEKCGSDFTLTVNSENSPELQCPECKSHDLEPVYEKHLQKTKENIYDDFSCFT